MTVEAWTALLTRWSKAILAVEEYRARLPPEGVASGWLGYPGATEAQIAQLETRLHTSLPPSYQTFLRVANGWRMTGPFIDHLWSAEEVEWHAVRQNHIF